MATHKGPPEGTYIVINAENTTHEPKYNSRPWIKQSGRHTKECAVYECKSTAEVGAHIFIVGCWSRTHQEAQMFASIPGLLILPFCKYHNNQKQLYAFMIKDNEQYPPGAPMMVSPIHTRELSYHLWGNGGYRVMGPTGKTMVMSVRQYLSDTKRSSHKKEEEEEEDVVSITKGLSALLVEPCDQPMISLEQVDALDANFERMKTGNEAWNPFKFHLRPGQRQPKEGIRDLLPTIPRMCNACGSHAVCFDTEKCKGRSKEKCCLHCRCRPEQGCKPLKPKKNKKSKTKDTK